MFRPPATLVEIGTAEDIKQYDQMVQKKSLPITPPKKPKNIFNSPIASRFQRKSLSTPTDEIDSPPDEWF